MKIRQKLFTNLKKSLEIKKSDTVWLAYRQGKIFQKLRSKERFVNGMVLKSKISKSTIVFEIALSRLIDEFPKIKDSSLPLNYFKKRLKLTREVCKENASQYK